MTDAIRDAAQARSELRQTEDAFSAMKAAAMNAWLSTKDGETAHREQLYRAVVTIEAVREHLFQIVATGDLEAAEQAFLKSLNQPD
jgi:hypothetical protein